MKLSHHLFLRQNQHDAILQEHIALQPGFEIILDTRWDVFLKEGGIVTVINYTVLYVRSIFVHSIIYITD